MAELDARSLGPDSAALDTIYLGGGTPTKLGGAGLADLIGRVSRRLGVGKLSTSTGAIEVTIEANPEDVSRETASAWRAAGVNRVSLGLQTFESKALKWMHREHGPEQARVAVEALRAAGVENLSVDLIFALPESLDRNWSDDLDQALSLDPQHVSLYGLTVELHTPLGRWKARGTVQESPEERYEAEFLEAHRVLSGAGFEHYEVSNYGRPGRHSRHNSAYWSGVPYLGLGPSAHGFSGDTRRWNRSAYTDWLAAVETGQDPLGGEERLGPAERIAEAVYLGIRTSRGLAIHQKELKKVTTWESAGWATILRAGAQPVLKLTPSGWLRMDALAADLIAGRQNA